MRALLRTQLGGVARRPSRLLLTGLAILVASFVVFAGVLTQQIVARTVLATAASTPEAADLVVGDANAGVGTTEAVLRRVRELPGVAEAVNRIESGVMLGESGGDWLGLYGDPGAGPLSLVKLTGGAYPDAANEIAVSTRTAQRMGLVVGSVTSGRVDPEAAPVKLTVTGLVEADSDFGRDAYAPDTFVSALAKTDFVPQLDLRLAPGADLSTVRGQIGRAHV